MLQKNQIIELVIDDIANDGSGVGRADGLAVFVPNTAVGDRISAKIVKATPRLAYGAVQELLSPGPGRSKDACSGCPVCRRCGSCSLRHLTYAEELRIKGRWVSENLRRIGGIDLPAPPCLPSPASDRYRNKAIYPIRMQNGEPVLGFYAKRSHRVEPIGDCLLHPEVFSALCRAVLGWIRKHRISVYDEQAHAGLIRSLYLRQAEATGEVMACMIVNGRFIPAERALTEALRKAKSPANVNALTNAMAAAVLSDIPYLTGARREIRAAADRLYEGLKAAQETCGVIRVFPTKTNFVFLETADAADLQQYLKNRSILVRRLGGRLRITACAPQENEAVISAVSAYCAERSGGEKGR